MRNIAVTGNTVLPVLVEEVDVVALFTLEALLPVDVLGERGNRLLMASGAGRSWKLVRMRQGCY